MTGDIKTMADMGKYTPLDRQYNWIHEITEQGFRKKGNISVNDEAWLWALAGITWPESNDSEAAQSVRPCGCGPHGCQFEPGPSPKNRSGR